MILKLFFVVLLIWLFGVALFFYGFKSPKLISLVVSFSTVVQNMWWFSCHLSVWFVSVKLAHNVLRVGDVALCCACGKAILLKRC
jgi:hypothetical protein